MPALPLALAGCNICGPDQRVVLAYADAGFTVERGTRPPAATTLNGSLFDRNADAREFEPLWDVFARGARPYASAAVTMTGSSPNQMVGVVLALPTPVRSGQHLTVGGAFEPPREPYVMYWSVWGAHTPAVAGQAELALRVSDFSPTSGPSNPFVATAATGTIDVNEIEGDTFRLQLDVVATDDAGETVRLRGPLVVRLEREPARCFS